MHVEMDDHLFRCNLPDYILTIGHHRMATVRVVTDIDGLQKENQ